jgi:transposase
MDMRGLSPAAQEALRVRVMRVVTGGMEVDDAVRVFGVSKDSIRNWQTRFETGGFDALRSGRPGRQAGEGTKLTPSEEQALIGAVIDYDPEAIGVGGRLWTAKKVCVLAKRLFGVSFTDRGMRKLLRRLGLSFQRPDKRATEADPAALREWTEQRWAELRERAVVEEAQIMFLDQVGVRSDHLSGRTWGRRGQTPLLATSGNRFGLNAMSAIGMNGKLYFTVFREAFSAGVFIAFLDRLLATVEGKVHLVLDGHSVHRSKRVRRWVAERAARIELHFLPPYAPHLNPDELVNADLKRHLADQVIEDVHQMEAAVRSFFRSVQKRADHVKAYFLAPHVSYTVSTCPRGR